MKIQKRYREVAAIFCATLLASLATAQVPSTKQGTQSDAARAQQSEPSDPAANSGGIAVSLDSEAVVREINEATQATHSAVLLRAKSKVDAASRAVVDLRRAGHALDDEARTRFGAAYDEARAIEKSLKRGLKEALDAKTEAWAESKTRIAADYEAYAQAVAQLEAVLAAYGAAPAGPR